MVKRIRRTELIQRITGTARTLWAVEGGAGFGKSVLLKQLSFEPGRPVLRLASPAQRPDPQGLLTELIEAANLLGIALSAPDAAARSIGKALTDLGAALVVDEIHRWDRDVNTIINQLANDPMLTSAVVIAGRLIGDEIGAASSAFQRISVTDLALSIAEIADLLTANGLDPDWAPVLRTVTGGWPIAADVAAQRLSASANPAALLRQLARHDSLVGECAAPLVLGLSSDDQKTATDLASLPFFDHDLVDSAGPPGGLNRLRSAGLPLIPRLDGWWQFVPEFRRSLATGRTAPPRPELVEYIADRGEIHSAINAFLAAGDQPSAAELLASVTRHQESMLDPTQLHAAVAAIGDAASAAPRCLYVHAHVSAVHGHRTEGLRSIERAVQLFGEQDPQAADPNHVETLLTLGLWRAFDGELHTAQAIVDRCRPLVNLTSVNENRALFHDLRGVLHHQYASDSDLDQAAAELRQALSLWRQLGEPEAATVTLFRLASGVLASSGRRAEALALLDQLPELGPMTLLTRGRLALERSWLLPYLGKTSNLAGQLAEAQRIATILEDKWLYASSLVAEIVAASFEYDEQTVTALAAKALAEDYITLADTGEALYWVDVVDALARCGNATEAKQQLGALREAPGLLDWVLAYITASVEARAGNASTAVELLDELSLRDDVEREKRWQVALLRGYAHARLNQHGDAMKYLQNAFDEASQIDQPSAPLIAERKLVEAIQAQTADLSGQAETFISIFDDFTVQSGGEYIDVPSGRASTLLKLMVVNNGRVVNDQAVDVLWPQADLALGRRRLRNVVRRVRATCGEVIERRDETLVFAESVTSDFAKASMLRRRSEVLDSMVDAIEASDRALLPDDRYEDWAQAARDQLASELVSLLDRLVALADPVRDIELVISSLQRALELDPLGTERKKRLADLLTKRSSG